MKSDFFNKIFRGDKGIWFIFMFLCMISVVEVFSASTQLSYKSDSFWGPISAHCIHMLMGVVMAIFVHYVPHKLWRLLGLLLLVLSLGMLFYLLVGPNTQTANDATRWIRIAGISVQPSEFAKLAVVCTTALLLEKMDDSTLRSTWKWFGIIMGIALVFTGLILPENLSTAALLLLTVVLMTLIAGLSWRVLLPVYGSGIAVVSLVLLFFIATPPSKMHSIAQNTPFHRIDTWQDRLTGFVVKMPDNPSDYDVNDKNRQISHALIAVASSGLFGVGPGNSVQRDFLSRADNDFIFSIVLEELGLLGGIFVLLLYIALLVRSGKIARRCKGTFGTMLVLGCALMLVMQAFVHMMISVNMFPITGQPLPLISRGGTSVVITCVYIGIILSVSRSVEGHKAPEETELQPEPQIVLPAGEQTEEEPEACEEEI